MMKKNHGNKGLLADSYQVRRINGALTSATKKEETPVKRAARGGRKLGSSQTHLNSPFATTTYGSMISIVSIEIFVLGPIYKIK